MNAHPFLNSNLHKRMFSGISLLSKVGSYSWSKSGPEKMPGWKSSCSSGSSAGSDTFTFFSFLIFFCFPERMLVRSLFQQCYLINIVILQDHMLPTSALSFFIILRFVSSDSSMSSRSISSCASCLSFNKILTPWFFTLFICVYNSFNYSINTLIVSFIFCRVAFPPSSCRLLSFFHILWPSFLL